MCVADRALTGPGFGLMDIKTVLATCQVIFFVICELLNEMSAIDIHDPFGSLVNCRSTNILLIYSFNSVIICVIKLKQHKFSYF